MNELPSHVDVVIFGAGIAGLSLADALTEKGARCLIIEKQHPGSGASGSPRVLVHPAVGRRAKMSWQAQPALEAMETLLKNVQQECEEPFYESGGIIRPALDEKLAKNFKRAPEKYNWPDGWVEWIEPEPFRQQFPQFQSDFGGLIVHRGFTIKGKQFIRALSGYLQRRGVSIVEEYEPGAMVRQDDHWSINLPGGKTVNSQAVVMATGKGLVSDSAWGFLPLHPVKGQTATFMFSDPPDLPGSVSSLGYMARLQHEPARLVVGSTYEHHPEYDEPDDEGLQYLRKKLDNTFPGLSLRATDSEQWAGYRVTVPDKKPVIGEHPDQKGLFVLGAFGSKGMSLGRYIAGILADHILNQQPVPHQISVDRFSGDK